MEMTAVEQRRWALAVLATSVVLLAGGYLVGHAGGADIDAARAAGTRAGTVDGRRQGRLQGYRAGYRKGYRTAYRAAYGRARRGG
jgi:hypothetical protein